MSHSGSGRMHDASVLRLGILHYDASVSNRIQHLQDTFRFRDTCGSIVQVLISYCCIRQHKVMQHDIGF
jgi:hypothetical protein